MNLFDGCGGQSLANGLKWMNEPPDWSFDRDARLRIKPMARSDFFRPLGQEPNDNACLLFTMVNGDFTAAARARARLVGFGDAAALTLRVSEKLWAKICVERSPIGEVSIVSVVTRDWSDDANSELMPSPECWLRITRKGRVFGMHYSLDGTRWRFVRCFVLDAPDEVMVGVHAQAPFEGGCEAVFDRFELAPRAVADFRSGE